MGKILPTMGKILDGWRSGGSKIDEDDGLVCVVESNGWGPTGRGRGGKDRPGRIGSGTSLKTAGSGRRGGREGDDGVSVCVGECLGIARGRGAGVSPGLSAMDGADGLV